MIDKLTTIEVPFVLLKLEVFSLENNLSGQSFVRLFYTKEAFEFYSNVAQIATQLVESISV